MFRIKNHACSTLAMLPFLCAPASIAVAAEQPQARQIQRADPLFLTITNGATNFLAVINTRTRETNYVPTGGMGGASGNAGGVAVEGQLAAAVNFGSNNVTIFVRRGDAMEPIANHQDGLAAGIGGVRTQPPDGARPDHRGILCGLRGNGRNHGRRHGATAKSDKSAAQIVSFDGGVAYTRKERIRRQSSMSPGGIGAGLSGPEELCRCPRRRTTILRSA